MKIQKTASVLILSLFFTSALFAQDSSNNFKKQPPAKPASGNPPPRPDGSQPPSMPDGSLPPEMPDGNRPPEMMGEGFIFDENSDPFEDITVNGAESIKYTFTTANNISKTYHAKYIVNGTTLDLSGQTIVADQDDEIAILVVNGGTANLTDCTIVKSGDGVGATHSDDYNFYGINNAIVVLGEGSITNLNNCTVNTAGEYSNAVFAADKGNININGGITITTTGSSSRGLFAAYGGTVKAEDGGVNISTQSIHCAALATDRGGGTVIAGTSKNAKASVLNTVAEDSPCIYSTGTIIGYNITGNCVNGQTVVVEGKNTVELTDCNLTGGRDTQGCIMLYQSMSGDAADEDAANSSSTLTITGCIFNAANGADMFVVTNTNATVNIKNCTFNGITSSQNFISAKEINWGAGAYLNVNATDENLSGTVYTGDATSSVTVNCKKSKLKVAKTSKGALKVNTQKR